MTRSNNNNKLKAFVRFDGSGRIIPSSLIVQSFKPKVGNWKEIDAKECCNYVPTTTSTTTSIPCYIFTISGTGERITVVGVDCTGAPYSFFNNDPIPWSITVCLRSVETNPLLTIVNTGICS